MVAQGFGITVLPDTPPVHRPGVKRLPVTDPVQTSDFYIVRQKAPHLLAAADQFFDYCVGQANGMDLTTTAAPVRSVKPKPTGAAAHLHKYNKIRSGSQVTGHQVGKGLPHGQPRLAISTITSSRTGHRRL
ncbi:MAG: hypothetical protein ACLUNZ_09995 [Evtepia sp.]